MIKPHFVILIDDKDRMQFEAKVLLSSLELFGGIKDYYFTIIAPEGSVFKLDFLKFVEKRAEIIFYKKSKIIKPYLYSPRWEFDPRSDFVAMLDSDVIVLKDIKEIFECLNPNTIKGYLGLFSPFKNKLRNKSIWKELYKNFDIVEDEKRWRVYNDRYFKNCPDEVSNCPFYFNHGVLVADKEASLKIKESKNDITERLMKVTIEGENLARNYFFNQIVTTIAIEINKINCEELEERFNCLRVFRNNAHIYHYSSKNNSFNSILEMKERLNQIKDKLDLINENILCGT